MPVHFSNPGHLDLAFLSIMGLSIKEGPEPFGKFGTGLKYAIATLLRTGHKIELRIGADHHQFGTVTQTVRGRPYERVTLDGELLPFGLELGKEWEVWQAYRELCSNARDEGGDVGPGGDTEFIVTGASIEAIKHDNIFLGSEDFPGVVRRPSNHVYYRGIRVYDLEHQLSRTFNIEHCTLSEDRAAKYEYEIWWGIRDRILALTNPTEIEHILKDPAICRRINFSTGLGPTSAFLDVVEKMLECGENPPLGCEEALRRIRPQATKIMQLTPTATELRIIQKACNRSNRAGIPASPSDFILVEKTEPGSLATYDRQTDEIYISRECLNRGTDFLAATIFEERAHQIHRYEDESRNFQQFLIDRIIALAEQLETLE